MCCNCKRLCAFSSIPANVKEPKSGSISSSFGQDQAIISVIGSSYKGAVDFRRWPAWDLRSHSLGDFFGVEMIFSA